MTPITILSGVAGPPAAQSGPIALAVYPTAWSDVQHASSDEPDDWNEDEDPEFASSWPASPAVPILLLPVDPTMALHLRSIRPDAERVGAASAASLALVPQLSSDRVDFGDPASQHVLNAIADALLGPLARQAARDDFANWLAMQQVRR